MPRFRLRKFAPISIESGAAMCQVPLLNTKGLSRACLGDKAHEIKETCDKQPGRAVVVRTSRSLAYCYAHGHDKKIKTAYKRRGAKQPQFHLTLQQVLFDVAVHPSLPFILPMFFFNINIDVAVMGRR